MQREYEAQYHALEERHWWFCARRNLVRELLIRACPDRTRNILEIGCSSGVLIQELRQAGYQAVTGIDISPEAIRQCQARGIHNVRVMDAQQLGFPDAAFDLITASDVLEHLAHDETALRDWLRVLKPGGVAIIFVPAFPSLWSDHDVANQHQRRYRRGELEAKVSAAGFTIERASYWNAGLFLPIAAIRAWHRLHSRPSGAPVTSRDLFPPPPPVNWSLYRALTLENTLFLQGLNFPFGVSAMVLARKPASLST